MKRAVNVSLIVGLATVIAVLFGILLINSTQILENQFTSNVQTLAFKSDSTTSDTKTLYVSIFPDDAPQDIEWSLSWQSSEATEPAVNYITITPTNAAGTAAEISCIKPFDEPITVTARSAYNVNAQATCTIHYIKRIMNLTGAATANGSNVDINFNSETLFTIPLKTNITTASYNFDFTAAWSAGTIENSLADISYSFRLTPAFKEHLTANGVSIDETPFTSINADVGYFVNSKLGSYSKTRSQLKSIFQAFGTDSAAIELNVTATTTDSRAPEFGARAYGVFTF